MAKNIRIGFIGCGGIANQKHLPGMAMEKASGIELVAFCDLVIERAEAACKQYGDEGAKVYTDYKELLADPTIDAVHVLTPNVAHCEISCAAMEAGKHVLCEKPMAATKEDAKKMMDTRDRTGKMLTIGYQYRHMHDHAVAKKVVEDGWLGDIYYAEATAIRRRGVPTWGVFTDKAKQGGGPLIDIATHSLDLVLWMMENYEPAVVVGASFEKLGTLLEPSQQGQISYMGGKQDPWDNKTFEVEDSAMGFVKMKNGAVIYIKCSWAINLNTPSGTGGLVTLCGTKGGLDTNDGVTINNVIAEQMSVTKVGQKIAPYIPGFSAGAPQRSREAELWVGALKGENELFVKAEQAYVVTQILDAIYESNRTGKAVYFD